MVPLFETKEVFLKKYGFVRDRFIWVSNTMPKFRKKLMIQFQENAWREGRMNRTFLVGPSNWRRGARGEGGRGVGGLHYKYCNTKQVLCIKDCISEC